MPRRLGQHFLARTSILQKIADAAVPSFSTTVVEIGPGKGALTHYLVERTPRVIAVEIDQVLVHYLNEKFRGEPKLQVVHADVLKTDLGQWGPAAVVGNLPYYITSPIIEKVLSLRDLLQNAVFLVQREVADRITAGPGSRDYGYLSVQCQLFSVPEYVVTVPPSAFRPPPNVDSAVVRLRPRIAPLVGETAKFLEFASACFAQKRKTLRNNLITRYPAIESQPESRLRAEQLAVEQLADLFSRVAQ